MIRWFILTVIVFAGMTGPFEMARAESRDTFLQHYHLRDGSYRTLGFRVEKIRKGSIYDRIGLIDGDVIKKINSKPITNSQEARYVFQELKSRKSLHLLIQRNGQEMPLHYQVK